MDLRKQIKQISKGVRQGKRDPVKMKRSRRTETESAETSQLSFMLSGSVSGPFVVLFSIPQQTTTGHIKRSGTKHRREQVCVCVQWSLFQQGMFAHPCLPQTNAT